MCIKIACILYSETRNTGRLQSIITEALYKYFMLSLSTKMKKKYVIIKVYSFPMGRAILLFCTLCCPHLRSHVYSL